MKRALTQKLGLLGVLSFLSYTAAVIFAPLAYPGYSWTVQAVSDLSAAHAPSRALWDQLSAFYNVCISCHTLFPPFLLPQKSWVSMMDTLENHFGDDASLDASTTESIKAFLVKNSAESSTKESSLRILASLEKEKTYLAITETPFWKNRHKKIDKAIFSQKEIGKPSNCKACHDTIENGLLNNRDIKRL